MKRMRVIQTHLPRTAAAALVFGLAACAPQATPIPAATHAATASDPALTPTDAFAEPAPTATLTPPPAPMGNEWLLVKTEQGLWTARPDGSQAGIRISGPIHIPVPIADAISPAGGLFAYIAFEYGQGAFANPVLHIASLTGREPAVSILLTSPETARTDNSPFNSIHDAMTRVSPYAWSPEGGRLAFIGAQEGPSADLYEYYRESGEIVRLTDGPRQAYRPVWSPGGEWIVHGAVGGFGSGAGFGVTGFYAARADGSGVISLYEIGERSGDEVVAGWLDAQTLVAHSWFATCGPSDLRLVDLAVRTVDPVFDGCIREVTVGPGVLLFAQSHDSADFEENPRPGLYILTASDRTPRLLSGENIHDIAWEEGIDAFLARTKDGRLLEVSPAGEIRELPAAASRMPIVSPDGRWWAYRSDDIDRDGEGIFAGTYGMAFERILDGPVGWNGILFSLSGDALYFITDYGELFRARAPDWSPALLASGLTQAYGWSDLAWWEELTGFTGLLRIDRIFFREKASF